MAAMTATITTMDDISFGIAIVVGMAFSIVFLSSRLSSSSFHPLPPGPTPWPLLGNIPQIGLLPHRSLARLAKKYGPVMLVRLGAVPCIIVSSPDAAREVFSSLDSLFSSRPQVMQVIRHLTDFDDLVFAPNDESWRLKRKLTVLHMTAPRQVALWAGRRQQEAEKMAAAMAACATGEGERGQAGREVRVEVRQFMGFATLNIIMAECFGRVYPYGSESQGLDSDSGLPSCQQNGSSSSNGGSSSSSSNGGSSSSSSHNDEGSQVSLRLASGSQGPFASIQEERDYLEEVIRRTFAMASGVNLADFLPWLSPLDPQRVIPRTKELRRDINAFTRSVIRQRKQERGGMEQAGSEEGEERRTSFLDFLLQHEGEGKDKLTEDQIMHLLQDMIVAGSDSPMKIAEWTLAELVMHPEWMARAQSEVDGCYRQWEASRGAGSTSLDAGAAGRGGAVTGGREGGKGGRGAGSRGPEDALDITRLPVLEVRCWR